MCVIWKFHPQGPPAQESELISGPPRPGWLQPTESRKVGSEQEKRKRGGEGVGAGPKGQRRGEESKAMTRLEMIGMGRWSAREG